MVLADDQGNPFREVHLADIQRGFGLFRRGVGRGGRFRREHDHRSVFGAQVFFDDGAQGVGVDLVRLLEVAFGKQGRGRVKLAGRIAVGLAAHFLQTRQFVNEHRAPGLADFLFREFFAAPLIDLVLNRGNHGVFPGGIEGGADAEQAGILGGLGPCVDAVHQLLLFLELANKPRTKARTDDRRQHVECGGVRVAQGDRVIAPEQAGNFVGACFTDKA